MEYRVRTGALTGYLPLLAELNIDAVPLLADVGLTPADLAQDDKLMAVSQLAALLNRSAKTPGLEDIGLRLASLQGLELLGLLGRKLAQCQTLAEAFANVQRYMALHNRAEHWRMQTEGTVAVIQRFEHCDAAIDLRHYHELAMANCFRLMQVLGGNTLRPVRLEFAHRARLPLRYYRQYFGCEVLFDQEQDRLLVPAEYLQRPVVCQAEAEAASDRFLLQLLTRCEDDPVLQVATVIQQALGLQQHSLEAVAALMDVHPRTLQRRLDAMGVVYRELVTEVRMKLARHHLAASDIDITLLSAALGYSDVSAFSRAFRTACGCSPRAWRQQGRA